MEEIRIPISSYFDIIAARQQGRAMAEQAGFKGTDLTVVYAVISEMARTIAESAVPGEIAIWIPQEKGKVGIVIIARTYIAKKTQELFFVHQLRQYMDEFKVSYEPGETIVTMKKWVDVWTEKSA